MKCPNCNETLKDDAKVCFSCGHNIENNEIDQIIDSMIKEDEAAKQPEQKPEEKTKPKKEWFKKKNNASGKGTGNKSANKKASAKNGSGNKSNGNGGTNAGVKLNSNDTKEPYQFGRGVEITRYITAAVVVFFLITMLFDWFAVGGRGAFLGFQLDAENSSQFMSETALTLSKAQIEALPPEEVILKFSPKDLVDYMKLYKDEYTSLQNDNGESVISLAGWVQFVYIQGFYAILVGLVLSILFLVFDKRLRTVEWSRGFSVMTMVIMGLNYAAVKVPFFSVLALKARSILRLENQLSSVTMNMNGINVNNEFYPYNGIELNGFFIAIGACVLWFVLTTVLVEMRKDKEYA